MPCLPMTQSYLGKVRAGATSSGTTKCGSDMELEKIASGVVALGCEMGERAGLGLFPLLVPLEGTFKS